MTVEPQWLANLHAQCFPRRRPWSAQEFSELLDKKGTFVLADGCGFILARTAADEAEILSIAVHPNAQRRGRASALLAKMEAQLKKSAINTGFLEVAENNSAALALYYRFGYRETGRRSGYYSENQPEPQNALILSKSYA